MHKSDEYDDVGDSIYLVARLSTYHSNLRTNTTPVSSIVKMLEAPSLGRAEVLSSLAHAEYIQVPRNSHFHLHP